MATTPGYQKRQDGNVYYVIGGNTMRIHEVLYKKGAELRLDAQDGILNLKGRQVQINGIDLTNLLNIIQQTNRSILTSHDLAEAIENHKTEVRNSIKANTAKVPAVPKLAQLATSLNALYALFGNDKPVPTDGITFERIDPVNATDWSEEEIVTAVNKLVTVVNALFANSNP